MHQPQQQQQQQPRAPLPLTVQPPRSPPPEDHPAHRIRHRSWSHTQLSLSPSMLQLPSASYPDPPPAAAAPAPAGHPPAASPSEAAPCVQPPPCAVASAPLAPTLRVSHHSHHAISTFSSTHCATTISAPLFPTAAAPPPAAPASRTSSDHLRQRPLFSPQSLPPKRTSMERTSPAPPSSPEAKNTNNSSTCSSGGSSGAKGPAAAASSHPSIAATHYTSPLSPHSGSPQAPQQSATHARLPAHPQQSAPHLQPQTLPAPALGGGSSRDAAMGRRHPLSLLLHGSSCMEQEPLRNAETHKAPRGPSLAKKAAGLARLPARLPSTSPPPAAAYVLPIPSITPAHPGAKAEIKQTLRADRACAQASALRKVASACELSGPVLAPAGSIGSGAESSTNERMRGARGGAPAASSSSSPFQLHSGKSSIGKAVSLWDSSCEQCGFSSSNSSSSCCIKCGADTLSAKAHRPSGTLHGALSGSRSSSAGTPTPSTLSCTLSSSIPSHLSRSSSNTTTSSSSTSNSFKEPPASAVAAPLEHAGLRHSLSTDVPEGMYAMMEPAYSGLASVPEAELEWAEDSGVGSEGGAAGAGPEGSLRPEQQQHKPKEAMARGRLGARLLASLRAVGSMANHAH
uniref:Uncharacterized protein n=1 Tax=Dunaliella tertiolecta TaxID=3047 RepID=A0A7S3VN09_DUNTE